MKIIKLITLLMFLTSILSAQEYRLPTDGNTVEPDKAPLMDDQRAMRLVRTNAAKWNVDPHKIGIMGFSAGGHLASTLGTHFDNGNPAELHILTEGEHGFGLGRGNNHLSEWTKDIELWLNWLNKK
jgi:acetyl esterase/lipase